MLEGGTAVDAAIAGLICNGVYSSQVHCHYHEDDCHGDTDPRAWVLVEAS